ncbi:MAG: hypothetical protein K0R65_2682 [Crocinitomicaceae bacterium]|jgi:ATP-dependent exoDNAse (exonuclease V) beta subunit|nr:hypothetical protein [Crocinitomicaceae bacterium]
MKPLQILSASAGSGKTYNLVLTYLKLVLKDDEYPDIFSAIIAMTFTNKAASEMKSRIIDALNLLSTTDPNNEKAQKYLADISSKLELPKEKIQQKAKLVLKQILHQYENFAVLTIDKFNLRLIRSFARDLNINNDFQTTTNEQEILSRLVDQVYSEINSGEQRKTLTEIALKLSRERFESEGKWDFKQDLNEFVSILLKEQNMAIIEAITLQDYSMDRYKGLKAEAARLKQHIQQKATELHTLFFAGDYDSYPGGSTTIKAFEKLKDVFAAKSDYELFFSPSLYSNFTADPKTKAFPEDLKQKALEFTAYYEKHSLEYLKITKFLDQYFFIALLKIIARELQNFKRTENIVLISEFNKLISDLLKDEYAPYIYERIGNRYKHFLLDEFQDTSRLQWINLIPLIHESLGKGQDNLIVGDPKQSIYRFKNGLAEQFVALPAIYNPEEDLKLNESSLFFTQMGELKPLAQNWRSKKEIVEFNNDFFNCFRTLFPEIIGNFYTDIVQSPQSGDGGYVYIESELDVKQDLSASFDEENPEGEESTEEEFPFLLQWISECLAAGYDYGDICVLDYQKRSCNAYASYLNRQGITVVSTDSLLLGADRQVKLLVQYIKWRNNPSADNEARRFAEMYLDYKTENAIRQFEKYWTKREREGNEYYIFDSDEFVQQEFGGGENFFFHFENLYQLVQKAYTLLGFEEFNSPYLNQFSDYVFLFDQNFGPELKLFIDYFEKEGQNTPVAIPENRDAVKIMTGHKSKGLEFPVVMMPSMRWEILRNQSKFLIREGEYIFYTPLSKSSRIAAIRQKYEEEFNQATLDKVNLNYVMFTRAQDRLYVRNVSPKARKYEAITHRVLQEYAVSEDAKIVLERGEKRPKFREEDYAESEHGKFYPQTGGEQLWFPEISLQDRELLTADAISEQRRFGNQLHEALSLANEAEQLDKVIAELILKGKVELELSERIRRQAQTILDFPDYRSLFDDAVEILREQSILLSENETKRPDIIIRKAAETIILDYKTGLEETRHIRQVKTYCNTLAAMQFPNVKGMIFYTSTLKLVAVN